MKQHIIKISYIFLIIFTFLLNAHADQRGIRIKYKDRHQKERETKLYSGYYALVAGCGNYTNGWPGLPNPVPDAREVAGMLKKMGWKVDLLENPNGKSLKTALNKIIIKAGKKEDQGILFWFSGHGHTLSEAGATKLGYLVPVDAPNPDQDELGFMNNAVSMRDIETVVRRIQSRHVLMLFDSCFSGSVFQAVRSKPSPYIEEKVRKPVRQFITAGSESEQVPDQSVFKTVFIQGIQDGYADTNKDHFITGMELGSYLEQEVINYSHGAQHPQFGKINDPKLDKGDFVIQLMVGSDDHIPIIGPKSNSSSKTQKPLKANMRPSQPAKNGIWKIDNDDNSRHVTDFLRDYINNIQLTSGNITVILRSNIEETIEYNNKRVRLKTKVTIKDGTGNLLKEENYTSSGSSDADYEIALKQASDIMVMAIKSEKLFSSINY